jgi:hypothetical protein
MVNRRHLLAVTALACLLTPSAASADVVGTFTAAAVPTHVKPSTSVPITITMTTNPLSSARAQRARIGIPSGFIVAAESVKATTSAVAGLCEASSWEADGQLIADQKIHLKRPGNNATSLCPGATLTVVLVATSAPADGTYAWTSELLRDADNVFTLTGTHPSVVVDGRPPAVTFTQKPSDPSNTGSPSFAFTAAEPAAFECNLDAGEFKPCSPPHNLTGLAEGKHTFAVKATDAGGNTGSETSYAWTVDTTPPTATITTKPSNPSNTRFPAFAFTARESGATFACKLDGGAFTPCNSPKTYANLAEISHTFVVKATDLAGNRGPETSYTWTIDTTPPTASITGHPGNPSNVKAPTFAFTANERGSTFSCRLDGAAFGRCTSPKAYANLADGVHTFTVRATDAADNVGASASYGWTIDTNAPSAAATSTRKSSALLAPRTGARVTRPPLLLWRRAARAAYYNVQLFRGRQKILSVWPTRPRLKLRARWRFGGRQRRLTPGAYRWYVWPGFGSPSARNYGTLLGQSSFVVVRSGRRR